MEPPSGLPAPPPLDLGSIALFADLDGTLAPIAATPSSVTPDPDRRRLLAALATALKGRIAVISGRSLADLDHLLDGRVAAVGAVHGLVRRTAQGRILAPPCPKEIAQGARRMADFARGDSGLIVEDKGWAVALHYRGAPQRSAAARALAARLGRELGLEVQHGRQVVELRAPGPDKGEALRAYMSEAPFAGRRPVFLGDDLTDEAGFRVARAQGGYGVIVGARRPTAADFALPDVAAVHAWLAEPLAELR